MITSQRCLIRTLLAAAFAVGLSIAVAQTPKHQAGSPSGARITPAAVERTSDCRTEVSGQSVVLLLGQSIQGANGWRNCVTYDGHPVIVYSAAPLKSTALAGTD